MWINWANHNCHVFFFFSFSAVHWLCAANTRVINQNRPITFERWPAGRNVIESLIPLRLKNPDYFRPSLRWGGILNRKIHCDAKLPLLIDPSVVKTRGVSWKLATLDFVYLHAWKISICLETGYFYWNRLFTLRACIEGKNNCRAFYGTRHWRNWKYQMKIWQILSFTQKGASPRNNLQREIKKKSTWEKLNFP